MGLELQYIGRVAEAKVECQGITVVAGTNGSGKSTVSKTIYALQESFYGLRSKAVLQKRRSITKTLANWQNEVDEIADLEVRDKIRMRREMRGLFLKEMEWEDFYENVTGIILSYEIEACGEDEIGELFDKYHEIRGNGIPYYESYVIQSVWERIFGKQVNTFGEEENAVAIYISGNLTLSVEIEDEQVLEYTYKKGSLAQMKKTIYITTSDLIDSLGSYRKGSANRYLRDNIYANEELAEMLLDEKSIQDWTAEEKEKIHYQQEILGEILDSVVDGDIQKKEGRLSYFENWCNHEVEFANVASGMKIFLILKRLLENGVFLEDALVIIDEPETNLHPEWQLKLAELLVMFQCKLGIQIYLNSHSPYFVRAMEYFADLHGALDVFSFYLMKPAEQPGMYESEDVTENLGAIYDQLAEPFNQIM